MAFIATIKGKEQRVRVEEDAPGIYRVNLDGEEYEVDFFNARENIYSLIIDHQSYEVDVDEVAPGNYAVLLKDDHFDIRIVDEKQQKFAEKRGSTGGGRQEIKSPMAGNLWKVLKQPGDAVAEGEVLLILEAMKMENEIRSPIDGVVAVMNAVEGAVATAGELLCVLEAAAD